MRHTPVVLALALCSAVALAGDPKPSERETAAVAELGRINGTALACGRADIVTKTKALMLLRVPTTRTYGEVYENATNAAFHELTTNAAACPEAVILSLRFEAADLKLGEAFPPMAPQQ